MKFAAAIALFASSASAFNAFAPKKAAAQPRRSLSLSGPPAKKAAPAKKAPVKKAPAKKAPAGVPRLSKWRKNGDGSITGLISGSANFREKERVTTSPIASGSVSSGEVVRTGSGSRYFLE